MNCGCFLRLGLKASSYSFIANPRACALCDVFTLLSMSVGFFQISLPLSTVFLELRNSGVTACRSSAHFASFPRNAIHKQQRVYYVRTHRDNATWRVTTALPEETRRGQTQTHSGGDTKTRLTSHLQFQFLPLSREETRRALKNNDAATKRQITFQKHDWNWCS